MPSDDIQTTAISECVSTLAMWSSGKLKEKDLFDTCQRLLILLRTHTHLFADGAFGDSEESWVDVVHPIVMAVHAHFLAAGSKGLRLASLAKCLSQVLACYSSIGSDADDLLDTELFTTTVEHICETASTSATGRSTSFFAIGTAKQSVDVIDVVGRKCSANSTEILTPFHMVTDWSIASVTEVLVASYSQQLRLKTSCSLKSVSSPKPLCAYATAILHQLQSCFDKDPLKLAVSVHTVDMIASDVVDLVFKLRSVPLDSQEELLLAQVSELVGSVFSRLRTSLTPECFPLVAMNCARFLSRPLRDCGLPVSALVSQRLTAMRFIRYAAAECNLDVGADNRVWSLVGVFCAIFRHPANVDLGVVDEFVDAVLNVGDADLISKSVQLSIQTALSPVVAADRFQDWRACAHDRDFIPVLFDTSANPAFEVAVSVFPLIRPCLLRFIGRLLRRMSSPGSLESQSYLFDYTLLCFCISLSPIPAPVFSLVQQWMDDVSHVFSPFIVFFDAVTVEQGMGRISTLLKLWIKEPSRPRTGCQEGMYQLVQRIVDMRLIDFRISFLSALDGLVHACETAVLKLEDSLPLLHCFTLAVARLSIAKFTIPEDDVGGDTYRVLERVYQTLLNGNIRHEAVGHALLLFLHSSTSRLFDSLSLEMAALPTTCYD